MTDTVRKNTNHVHKWKARELAGIWICPTCGERKPMTREQLEKEIGM